MSALLLAAAILAAEGRAVAAPASGDSIYWNNDLGLIVKTQESKIPEIDKVLGLIETWPGMTILDIGAGSGQQSYKLAEKLRGTGSVIATDIDPQLVDYIAAQARKKGLKNLRSVLVKKDGVDAFYDLQKYDLILLYDVVSSLSDRVNYYRHFRKLLTPRGRVAAVLHMRPRYGFSRDDFRDWEGFLSELRKEPEQSPFGRRLRRPLQAALDANPGAGSPALTKAVLSVLSTTLRGRFFTQFAEDLTFKEGVSFTPEEKTHGLWLLHRLKLAGLPRGRPISEIAVREQSALRQLNKLLLIARYRPYLIKKEGDRPYMSGGAQARWRRKDDPGMAEFLKAGYKLERKYDDIIPFMAVYFFR